MTKRGYASKEAAARGWAKRRGVQGNSGGWIYPPAGFGVGTFKCQGWSVFADRLIRCRKIALHDGRWVETEPFDTTPTTV